MTNFAKLLIRTAPLALIATTLPGCFNGDGNDTPPVMVEPMPTPTPVSFDVTPCLEQMVPGTGVTVAGAVVPDTLTINLAAASGFPNGRRLADPVIDVTLAVIFLDLTQHGAGTFAGIPLNPPANDVAFQAGFPYLGMPQGNPPLADMMGSGFNFRTDDPGAYTRVDRMGMPAISTVLIGSDSKNAYNDADPADDAAETFVGELATQLTGLTEALADDLTDAGLTPCATAS